MTLFLAVMSSSRSDVVTHSVRPFVTKEFFLSLKSFNCVSRVFKGCLMFKGSFKDVWRKFQGCLEKVLRVYTKSFRSVSRKFQLRLKEVSRVFE